MFSFSTSIRRMSLLALATLGLPLVVSLLFAVSSLQKLSVEGQRAAFVVAQLVADGQQIDEQLINMERNARQFLVLGDPQLAELFIQQQRELVAWQTPVNNDLERTEIRAQMVELVSRLWTFAKQYNQLQLGVAQQDQLAYQLQELKALNSKYQTRIQEQVSEQANSVDQRAEKAQQQILWSLLLLPIATLAAIGFVWIITRPIKQLGQQIQILEQGDFSQTIDVKGPSDVVEIAIALEAMRSRLQYMEAQKNRFIRHISHELKTPLAAIREGNELLYDHSLGSLNESQHEVCQILQENSLKLQQHIEDLLNFNHIIDATPVIVNQSIAFPQFFRDLIKAHLLTVQNKGLDIQLEIEQQSVWGNQEQLRVIFDNLLSNAIKFSPHLATIVIHSRLNADNLVCVSVEDQAGGIDAEFQSHMFEPFSQARASVSSPLKGSGLGLTIVKELIERNQAKLLYRRSEKGSVFEVCGLKNEK